MFWKFLLLCVLIIPIQLITGQNCKLEKRCRISRIHGMKSADCYQKDMRNFPQCITSDIEIIDVSYNRLRKLTKKDLKKYSNLKMLYLSDNVLLTIDDEAFEDFDDLQTLDLSLNALSKLPPIIFQLPSLKSLYLGQNVNMNIIDTIEEAKPINAPLTKLDISYISIEEYQELPDLGIIPHLMTYNISGNKIFNLTPKHFAGICNLQYLDTNNVTLYYYDNPCNCWIINRWLKERKVKFNLLPCSITENSCSGNIDNEDLQTFNKCNERLNELNTQLLIIKIIVPCIIIIIVAGVVLVYCYMRRRRQKFKTLNDKEIPLNSTEVC